MASPQKENGFTSISNELIEVLNCFKLTDYERVVIYTIMRKTYGWGKKSDWISHSQISDVTGVPRPHIVRTVTKLKNKKILYKDGRKIGIQKDWELWDVIWRVVPQQVLGSTSVGTSTSTSVGTHKRKKESIQKKLVEPSSKILKANQENMGNWNKTSDDFEEELQVDPDYKPKGKTKKTKKTPDDVQAVFNLFSNPAKVTWRMRELERVAAQALFDTYGLETLKKRITRIEKLKKNDDPLFPLVVTPSQLLDKMPNVERYLKS